MRRLLGLALTPILVFALSVLNAPVAQGGKGSLATLTGTVRDEKGNPLAGAVISLIKAGAKEVVKEIRTRADGSFNAKIAPGRYGLRAVAEGFSAVIFEAVEIHADQQLVYRFNLQPVGTGNTLPEKRRDRDDVRWRLRATQTQRSIFQIQEGDDQAIAAALGNGGDPEQSISTEPTDNDEKAEKARSRTQGVIETYFASNRALGTTYSGLNFAVATPATDNIDLVFAGQMGVGPNAPERLEATSRIRVGDRHRLGMSLAGLQMGRALLISGQHGGGAVRGQVSVRAVDEWIVRDGIVILLGVDYSRFIGAGGAHSFSPRFGVQVNANARTRVRAAYAPGGDESRFQSVAAFESGPVAFAEPTAQPVAYVDGRAVLESSRRLEIGVERVLDNNSNLEATAFFDTTSGRGVGLLSTPLTEFSGATGEALLRVANQQGAARGMRVVYTRRLSRVWTAEAGYSFGRGQQLAAPPFTQPNEVFSDGFFQTGAVQVGAGFGTGTYVRTVLRFSPGATVFAIDPFAGRLGVYDPSLSIQVTQELPTFGLPLRAEAVFDARNLLDSQASTENADTLLQVSTFGRSLRGGISVRF
jgi:Carboxypeptidase regulatory-like domain